MTKASGPARVSTARAWLVTLYVPPAHNTTHSPQESNRFVWRVGLSNCARVLKLINRCSFVARAGLRKRLRLLEIHHRTPFYINDDFSDVCRS